MPDTHKKLFIMVTNGPENSELATLAFVMAAAAQASDVEVTMGFQGSGSTLTVECIANHVSAQGLPRLADLISTFVEEGGRMYVCGPCIGSRDVKEEELIEGTQIVGAATFVAASLEADQALVY